MEAERQAATVRTLEADLRSARKEMRQKENERSSLKTQLLQLRDELKEAHAGCRDTGENVID